MIVKYIHIDNPEEERIFDSVKAFRNMPFYFKEGQTQEGFDEFEKTHFAEDKKRGIILSYAIVEP